MRLSTWHAIYLANPPDLCKTAELHLRDLPCPLAPMRALTMTGFGDLDRLAVLEVPRPALASPDDVLVRIRAAALNRIDLTSSAGYPRPSIRSPTSWGPMGPASSRRSETG